MAKVETHDYHGDDRRSVQYPGQMAQRVITFVLASVVTLQTWQVVQIVDLQKWRAATEANRYTIVDASTDKAIQLEVLTSIRNEISAIRTDVAKLPREVPPAWFLAEVKELKLRVRELEKESSRIQ